MTDTDVVRAPSGDQRLLAGAAATLAEHVGRHGPLPVVDVIAAVDAAGLRGRGGAGFPTGHKLRAVAGRRRVVVVANGCESEPASDKDHVLLTVAPHLVLDGIELAAHAVGATEAVLCVHRGHPVVGVVTAALAQRAAGVPVRVAQVPARYVASEESALVNFLTTGEARPTTKPPRPFERGVRGRPTLVDNVETLAHIALIARHGPDWFRARGTAECPGTALFTVTGAVTRPGVCEVASGTPIGTLLNLAGGVVEPVQAVLAGGYAGTWLPQPFAGLPVSGVASVVALPARACGLGETARLLRYLAGESARQCGPCTFGLPAIAQDFHHVVLGGRVAVDALARLHRRLAVIPGRGACGHPDGAVGLAASALRAFEPDVHAHAAGHPCRARPYLPVPNNLVGWR